MITIEALSNRDRESWRNAAKCTPTHKVNYWIKTRRYIKLIKTGEYMHVGCETLDEQINSAVVFICSLLLGRYLGIASNGDEPNICIAYQTGLDTELLTRKIETICEGKEIHGNYNFLELPLIDFELENWYEQEYKNIEKRREKIGKVVNAFNVTNETNVLLFINFSNLATYGANNIEYDSNKAIKPYENGKGFYFRWISEAIPKYCPNTICISIIPYGTGQGSIGARDEKNGIHTLKGSGISVFYQLRDNIPVPLDKGQLKAEYLKQLIPDMFDPSNGYAIPDPVTAYWLIKQLKERRQRKRAKDDIMLAHELGIITLSEDISGKCKKKLPRVTCTLSPEYQKPSPKTCT